MSEFSYRRFHPKWHREPMPIFWWLGRWPYTKFILRELTSLAVAYTAILLVVEIAVLERGPEAHAAFVELLTTPVALVVNGLVLVGLVFHTVTWLSLAPKALVVRIGGRRLPDAAIVAGHYAAWLVASLVVLLLFVGGR